jgi:hypothetical protein
MGLINQMHSFLQCGWLMEMGFQTNHAKGMYMQYNNFAFSMANGDKN